MRACLSLFAEINEMFRSYTSDPILVIVDVNPKGELEIPTQAYVSIESKPEESSVSRRAFRHVLSEVGAYEAEEVGVEHLLRNVGDTSESSLTDQVRAKVSSLKALRNRLQDIALYVDRVLSGKLPVNHAILYNLQDMFNLMPDLQLNELSAAFTANTNDNQMTIYISSLIRSICALHDLIKSVQAIQHANTNTGAPHAQHARTAARPVGAPTAVAGCVPLRLVVHRPPTALVVAVESASCAALLFARVRVSAL